jgi:FeoC like transcriptional regulator
VSRPLTSVLAAVEGGAVTVAEVVDRTAISEDTVRAALEVLTRMGRVHHETLASGCPAGGCGTCGVASSCSTGPVPVSIGHRR